MHAAGFGGKSNAMSKEGSQETHSENWGWDRSPQAPRIGRLVCERATRAEEAGPGQTSEAAQVPPHLPQHARGHRVSATRDFLTT